MKIIHIVPGFGGTFYCGNCLRDSAFSTSIRKLGHEALMLPMYMPLTIGSSQIKSDFPVFYGAVNIYIKQAFPFMRNMPGWLENFFNSPSILKFAASKSGSTRASGLAALTESMLLGSKGNQAKELRQLIDYLKVHEKPDIVHFSNALLLGMAKEIREELQIPVVCSLQDEDVWVDAMHEKDRQHMWDLLATKVEHVDKFVSVSSYFAGVMSRKMNIPSEKMKVIPIGIDPSKYKYSLPAANPPVLGYLSRICEENGFAILVDAFILLKSKPQFREIKLKATGGFTGDDHKFIKAQWTKLKKAGIEKDMEIIHEFEGNALHNFLKDISLLSVPVLQGEAFGMYQLEALASGKPIMQPELGAFPEIVRNTGGGWTYSPNTAEALAAKLEFVLSNPDELKRAGKTGYQQVENQYNSSGLAAAMLETYQEILTK
ncbi:MAG: glycosyltransferase family 4 protein [Bacteroidales bacterium]|nr:glycosyltransferase family 4 protein [Bacteroidales bacterium]